MAKWLKANFKCYEPTDLDKVKAGNEAYSPHTSPSRVKWTYTSDERHRAHFLIFYLDHSLSLLCLLKFYHPTLRL